MRRTASPSTLQNLLIAHSATSRSAWGGAELDGRKGLIRALVARVKALCLVTYQIAGLGFATPGLLHIISGSWVSVLLFRRRLLCLLDLIVEAVRGKHDEDIVQLSPSLRLELISLVLLAPLAVSNPRADVAPWLGATDASNWGVAHVRADVPPEVAGELYRFTEQRGKWTRILPSSKRWLRGHGLLDPELEMPDGSVYGMATPFEQSIPAVQFRYKSSAKYRRRPHINIGECGALMDAERAAARERPCSRIVAVSDSQVVVGAATKGRSASPALNGRLQQGLATFLGGDIYTVLAWVPSAMNPGDDPTRDAPVRKPSAPLPDWWDEVASGEQALLDSRVAKLESAVASYLPDIGFCAASSRTARLHLSGPRGSRTSTLKTQRYWRQLAVMTMSNIHAVRCKGTKTSIDPAPNCTLARAPWPLRRAWMLWPQLPSLLFPEPAL